MKQLLLAGLSLAVFSPVFAQKKVLEYPFQLDKRSVEKGEWAAQMQRDFPDSSGLLILKNNENTDFVCVDREFSVKGKIGMPVGKTAPGVRDNELVGSIGKDGRYELLFNNTSQLVYTLETVDFSASTVVDQPSLELTPDERFLAHFAGNNNFYVLASDDKAGQLVVYTIGASGAITRKSNPFTIPADASKRDKISAYLSQPLCLSNRSEYDPIAGTQMRKVFYRPEDVRFVVNDKNGPTHVITVTLPDCRVSDKAINIGPGTSWLVDDRLFSMVVTKGELTVFAHNPATGQLLKKYSISADAGAEMLAETPKYEKWNHKLVSSKEQDVKKAVRAFSDDVKGIWAVPTEDGRVMVMLCTFDFSIQYSRWSTGSTGPATHGGFQPSGTAVGGNAPPPVWVPNSVTSTFSTTLSYVKLKPAYRWYGRTDVRLLLDPATLKPMQGKTARPVSDEVEDYVGTAEKKKMTQLANGRWVGYYNPDTRQYVIEEVELHN